MRLLHLNSPTPICGSTIIGATTYEHDIDYHYFTLTEAYISIIFNSCGSGYDTYLYFQDSSGSTISECDDCGDYRIGIGGHSNNYGSRTVTIACLCQHIISDKRGGTIDIYDTMIIEMDIAIGCIECISYWKIRSRKMAADVTISNLV